MHLALRQLSWKRGKKTHGKSGELWENDGKIMKNLEQFQDWMENDGKVCGMVRFKSFNSMNYLGEILLPGSLL